MRLWDGVAKRPLLDLRGVALGFIFDGPVGDVCFRFLESPASCLRFSRRVIAASRFLSRPYSLYFAAGIQG